MPALNSRGGDEAIVRITRRGERGRDDPAVLQSGVAEHNAGQDFGASIAKAIARRSSRLLSGCAVRIELQDMRRRDGVIEHEKPRIVADEREGPRGKVRQQRDLAAHQPLNCVLGRIVSMFYDLGDVIFGQPIRLGNRAAIDGFVVGPAHSFEAAGQDAYRSRTACFGNPVRSGSPTGAVTGKRNKQLGARRRVGKSGPRTRTAIANAANRSNWRTARRTAGLAGSKSDFIVDRTAVEVRMGRDSQRERVDFRVKTARRPRSVGSHCSISRLR